MKEIKETILITMMSLLFWGILYPEFSLTTQTYCSLEREEQNPERDFFEILNAPSGKIIVKSRLLEWISNSSVHDQSFADWSYKKR